ncbi:butyrophilin subfamily 2 member A2-like isoform X3 [Neoarius graeffei]|uniref:butyrophilin subfamily 2 member A2-like isoform X3 n=1 Tax=Neoarius graeffei TaxID=443677 RepID=UPI00298BCDFE|nr:butyrophilin subfamily 2 member A2-like isoform X3 [Neoarius graeffei]
MISGLSLRWVLLFLFPSLSHQTSSGIFSLKVQSPVSALLGSSVSLHCALANSMDVRHLEVRWYRPKMLDTSVLLYKNTQIQKSPVDVQYQGRVFLLGELEKGDVSLKMENLMLADRGDYVCYVSSDDWYDKATVSLSIRAVGSTPVLSINEAEGGKMNVSCQSHGWLPEPSIIWTDKDGRDLKHLSKNKFINNSEGVIDVTSWLIVSPSSTWISCSVGLSDQERKDSRITLSIPPGITESVNGYAIAIPVLLLLCAAGIAVFCMLHKKGLILSKRKRTENTGDKTSGAPSEREPLNKIPVENQDQNDAPSMNTVPDDVVVDIDQNSEQKADIPPTSTPNLNQQKSSEQQNPEAVKEKPQLRDLNQQKSSEQQNPEAVKEKPQLRDKTSGAPSEREPLNKIPVENQDQNDAPSMNTVPDDVVVDIDQNSEQKADIPPTSTPNLNQQKSSEQQNPEAVKEKPQLRDKTSGAPSEREPLNKIPVENQDQNDAPSMNTVPDDVVVDIDQNSEQKADRPPTSTPNLSQQKSSEQQNPEAVKEKPQLRDLNQQKSSEQQNPEAVKEKLQLTDKTSGAPSEREPLNKIPVENQDQNDAPSMNTVPDDVVGDIDQNSEQKAEIPSTSTPNLSQQKSSEQQNPEAVKEKPQLTDLDEVKKFKVNITIDPDETPEFLTEDRKEVFCSVPRPAWDINSSDEDEKVFTLCKARFNVGKRYWEVKVRESHKIEKLSWFVGVASEAAERECNIPLTPQNKFWVLSYEKEKGLYIRDKAELISLPDVHKELTAVGVFLDCDEHTLSFYNINTKSHIYTFTNVEPRRISLRPLISPGVRDNYPVCIL